MCSEMLELVADICYDFLRFDATLCKEERYGLTIVHWEAVTKMETANA